MKFLGILSLPRSGTNHLSYNLLASNERVLNLGEIFHNLSSGVDAAVIDPHFPSYDDFRAAALADPFGTLRLLASGSEADVAVFKVFPDHMPDETFERLARDVDGFVVLTRNPLSTWVSNRIALESGRWFSAPTDDRTVQWNPADFIDHTIERLGYLNDRSGSLRAQDVPTVELTYPEISRPDVVAATLWNRIALAIPSIAGAKIVTDLTADRALTDESESTQASVIFKQDSRIALHRIENWQLADAELERWGLQWLGAEDAPFDRIALVNLLKAIRIVRAKEDEILAFRRDTEKSELEQRLAAEKVRREIEQLRAASDHATKQAEARLVESERAAQARLVESERAAQALLAEHQRAARARMDKASAESEAERSRLLAAEAEQAKLLLAEQQRIVATLVAQGNHMAEELRQAYAHPWRPLKRSLQRFVLRFALLFRGLFPDPTIQKLRRALARRKPGHYAKEWRAVLRQALGSD